tara:strand:+ start:161 stop:355 length:195 start_codon:yes stop_codon:yes gene_type:complete
MDEKESIKAILIRRDKMTSDEADDLIQDARQQFNSYLEAGDITSAEDICSEYFGLEPDYVIEFF